MSRKINRSPANPDTASVRRAVRYALAGLVSLSMVPPVLAGPDPCTVTAASRTCEGNQANGVLFTTWPKLLYVWNVTADITPLSGSTGVKLTLNGGAGDNGGYSPVGAGGDGDAGGGGGDPTVTFDGGPWRISTTGTNAFGIQAQANGGRGGNGGAATGFPIPPIFILTGPAFGGHGGRGGDGGPTALIAFGSVVTTGSGAYGIFAESFGGRGGDGNWAVSTTYSEGGDGGGGGNGKSVTIENAAAVQTGGADAHGIFAQSAGGRGGNGGWAFGVADGVGGSGGVGGDGGNVTITNSGTVSTAGSSAFGIYGRSAGGEGGDGGEGDGIFGSGGAGLGSGDGGAVAIVNSGGVTTTGADATGVFAQSVGGFAGSGAAGGGLFAWGGSGNSAGHGGAIDVVNSGAINTSGSFAYAIHGQSVGGGGGSGGSASGVFSWGGSGQAGGDGGVVTIGNSGQLQTAGADAAGVFAQSVGGGGGSGGDAGSVGVFFSLAMGGTGGPGGDGGVVTVGSAADATITTGGARAPGIFAQSVGGGGGNGGYAVSLSAGVGVSASVSIGGNGNEGGGADDVTVDSASTIHTTGSDSHGIRAESIGGGGGSGGGSISAAASDTFSAAFAFGGKAGGGGDGADVTVSSIGSIDTGGERSAGIAALSLGGGGGSGGWTITGSGAGVGSLNVGIGGAGGLGGSSGVVTVTSESEISTLGAKGYGIDARSIGGGGGDGGWNLSGAGAGGAAGTFTLGGRGGGGGDGNDVTVSSTGAIQTLGLKATGIVAESTGGGGGDGGWGISGAGAGGGALTVTIGGSGGGGGDGGFVILANGGSIQTQGDQAYGIRARSVGGGGGDGGFTISGAGAGTAAGTFSLGGTGGGGGDGKAVTVDSSGDISTSGSKAVGILAESVGGGGGDGGWNIAGSGAGTGALSVVIGGRGGDGGSGSDVTLSSTGDITTTGERSYAIRARSIGGGGGDGGFSISGAGAGAGAMTFNLGGSGGLGGSSGIVDVTTGGAIITGGARSAGILAESIGGGGGDGGFSITGAGAGWGAVSVGIGGSGGLGGSGADVTVASGSDIFTTGERSHGIRARSIGGGGGDGGFSISGAGAGTFGGTFNLGGSGDVGGNAGAVTVSSSGDIATQGSRAAGILAESIGGGGGDGGFSITGSGAGTAAISVGIGGSGDGGGNAAAVTVDSTSAITTLGERAYAIRARSIGGGGGDGGFSLSGAGAGTFGGTFSLGGSGGAGGHADSVTVDSSGTLATSGEGAAGILAESIGGGGGDGGFSITGAGGGWGGLSVGIGGFGDGGGDGGTVDVTSASAITTLGGGAYGIRARSIGGGGGDGGFSLSGAGGGEYGGTFNLGGFGDAGGNASSVAVKSTGEISTAGARAAGILAESIGGGGGDGGFSITGSGAGTGALSIGIGGGGATGGNAAAVTVDSTSLIATLGERAHAIRARSIGGGGGDGAFSLSGAGAGEFGATFSLGGSGGGGGDAETVTVASTGLLSTAGTGAAGILAESIGGGGGDGGFSITGAGGGWGGFSVGIGGFGAGGGDGKAVTVTSDSTIATEGDSGYGIRARSLGGGGGDGGFSITGAGGGDYGGTFSLGGYGDEGGDAAAVTVTSTGDIATLGYKAAGIMAESIGGGGGDGGWNITGSGAGTGALSIGIGGGGGGGGNAGAVTVTNDGGIATAGAKAHGIRARSIGGGGGDGAFSITGSGAGDYSGTFNLGGFADDGGDGGSVTVYNHGAISVAGKQADGVLASSVGGGGGNGGWSVSGSGSGKGAFNVNIGGFGGDGGYGGAVSVENSGQVVSTSQMGRGIVATSLGGGGGDGGFAFVGGFGAEGAKDISLALGGFGGDGSWGGEVQVVNAGIVDVSAIGSHGILATSTGGGGGNGGASYAVGLGFGGDKDTWNVNVSAAVGGFGGDGNFGGEVLVDNAGSVVTRNHDAHGIVATSTGGGGGDGGSSFAATVALAAGSQGRSINGSISVGGFGGTGNVGGAVQVTNSGDIVTLGDKSDAIHAQSIGGGGGNGGKSTGLSLLLNAGGPKLDPKKNEIAGGNWNLQVNVGGFGGDGNDGGMVTVVNDGDIVTEGVLSRGIMAQSIGAGGGSGGEAFKGTDTAADYITLANNLGGSGKMNALLKQLRDWSFTVGGDGGASGNAEDVVVENSGSIFTRGMGATGIFVQSIGGGGGESQNYVQATSSGGTATAGATGKVAIGGAGGAAGDGGDVTIDHSGDITTLGDEAYGIYAQSIGGGGGKAGNIDRALAEGNSFFPVIKNIGLGLSFGRDGGGGGDGGTVTITSSGDIFTSGADAAGIHAQSVGGGGGEVGGLPNEDIPILSLLSFKGSVGGDGAGGEVTVSHSGNITTTGPASDGVFAQSAGGQGTGGDVNVELWGEILALGADSSGIVAQSLGQAGNGNLSITVHDGVVQGGTGDAAGIYLHDGAVNSVVNRGLVTTIAGIDGEAIIGTLGDDTIVNHGIIAGSLRLGAGSNQLENLLGAELLAGDDIDLGGDANVFMNSGALSPGSTGRILDTGLTGSLVQGATGTMLVDLDVASGAADHVSVSGSAGLDGLVSLNLLNVAKALPSSRVVEILSGQGAVTDTGLALVDIDTAVFHNELLFKTDNRVVIQSVIDFSPDGLNRNQRAIGEHVDDIQLAGSSWQFEPISKVLFYLPDVAELANAYDHLSAESFAHAQVGSVLSSMDFGDAMLSCRSREGQFRFVEEDECGWMRLSYRTLSRDHDNENFGFDEDSVGVAAGVQGLLSEQWYAGLAFSFEDVALDTGQLARSDGMRAQAGFMLKGRYEADTIAIGVSGGHGSFDTRRRIGLPESGVEARADYDLSFLSARLRWSHVFEMQSWYVLPSLDLSWTGTDFDSFTERGAAGASLRIKGGTDDYFTVTPMLEIGGEIATAGGTQVRPFAKIGVDQFTSGLDPSVTASFQGAPDGVAPFRVTTDLDDTLVEVAAGLDVLRPSGVVLRLSYVGQFGSELDGQGVVLRITKPL